MFPIRVDGDGDGEEDGGGKGEEPVGKQRGSRINTCNR
jgi:hypothetical protein